jgi:RNA polymerase sigma-70 factor (ECF subfamily)
LTTTAAEQTHEEADLAGRFAAGEAGAFDAAVERFSPRVARLAQRLLGWRDGGGISVEDVVQDVFVAALRKRRSIRGKGNLWPWLATITVNRCRSHGRRARLWRRWFHRQAEPSTVRVSPSADRLSAQAETCQRVRDAVEKLSTKDREVVVLYHLEELSVAEIVAILGTSRGAIDVRLHRARKRLAELLGGHAENDVARE